jgi:hypothetical protein
MTHSCDTDWHCEVRYSKRVRLRLYGWFVISHFKFLSEYHSVIKCLMTNINLHYVTYRLSRVQLAPPKEHTVCSYEKHQSGNVYEEKSAVLCGNCTKYLNTLCGRKAEFWATSLLLRRGRTVLIVIIIYFNNTHQLDTFHSHFHFIKTQNVDMFRASLAYPQEALHAHSFGGCSVL